MRIEPIVSRFRKLSSDDKIRLVQEFWDEIAEEVAHMPLTESQRRLLDERLTDEQLNPDDVEPWAKAKDDILREVGCATHERHQFLNKQHEVYGSDVYKLCTSSLMGVH